jgi:deoxynucleoside triphosphate triphosphohydrolase SAMHD1
VFARRFELFKSVYLHKTSTALDYMTSEALVLANSVYKFDEMCFDPQRYLKLMNDDLLKVISRSKDPRLAESKKILKRIEYRDLYKVCGEAIISREIKGEV